MSDPPASWANMDVYLLTMLLERALPLEKTHWRDKDFKNRRHFANRRCMQHFGTLRLVCKHWYKVVGHCQLHLKIDKMHLLGFPEVRNDGIGSLLASLAPGSTAVEVDAGYIGESDQDRKRLVDIDSLAALQNLSTLRMVGWQGARFSAERFTRLQELIVTYCSKLDVTWLLAVLPNLTQLTSFAWECNCYFMPDEGFAGLGQLTRLKELSVLCSTINTSVSTFSTLQQLERLNLQESYDLDEAPLAALSALKNLRCLNLMRCDMLKELAYLHNTALTCLNLAGCGALTDDAMVQVAKLTNLESLNLSGTNLHDWGLKQLSSMTRLTKLEMINAYMATIDGLRQVPNMRTLTPRELTKVLYLGEPMFGLGLD